VWYFMADSQRVQFTVEDLLVVNYEGKNIPCSPENPTPALGTAEKFDDPHSSECCVTHFPRSE